MENLVNVILSNVDFIYTKFILINFYLLGGIISNLALVLIGIIITVFILTVTLSGRATRLAKEKKMETEQKSKQEFVKNIKDLKKKLDENPEDLESIKKQISDLEEKKKYLENQLKELEIRYNAFGLKEGVFMPGGLFLISLIFGNWIILISQNQIWHFASFLLALAFLVLGIKKIISSLYAISDVSLNSDDYQFDQLQNALTQALKTVESEKEPKPSIIFEEKPPFIFKANTEASIKFSIDLLKPGNMEAKNVDVWFLSSPEIVLLKFNNSGRTIQTKSWLRHTRR